MIPYVDTASSTARWWTEDVQSSVVTVSNGKGGDTVVAILLYRSQLVTRRLESRRLVAAAFTGSGSTSAGTIDGQ
jgi:hypothetical protein